MSLEDLGNIGEFVAAVGVIISLVYLAVQIRQNTRSIQRAGNQQILHGIAELNQFLASTPEITDLFWRGSHAPESLSEDEWHRFVHIASAMIRRMELTFLNHRDGFVPPQRWEAQAENFQRWLTLPGIQRWFSELGAGVDAEFRDYVEQSRQ